MTVWTVYLDSRRSRRDGRKVPKDLAVVAPTVQELGRAAEELGLNPKVEEEPIHPRDGGRLPGYVVVDRKRGRSGTLRAISRRVFEMRAASDSGLERSA
jgi:signal recognition particle subunit SRP19